MFDLEKIRAEMAASPMHSPMPLEVAKAVMCDCFRMAGKKPPAEATIRTWLKKWKKLAPEQMGAMAHYLATTSLRDATVRALSVSDEDLRPGFRDFFVKIEPLTAEMIRSNSFRQEEALRRWAEWLRAPLSGETPEQSAARIEKLDYRKTLDEYGKAEKARKREQAERARLLKEAEEKEAAARGWRE